MKRSLILVLMTVGLFAAGAGEELQIAARRGQLAEVKKLLEAGAPLEEKNQYGATPLFLAVFNGHSEVALFLLDKGANPNVTDTFYKSSILDSALQAKNPTLITALVAKGAGATVRHLNMAVEIGEPATLQAILAAPFKPEERTAALKAAIVGKKEEAAAVLRKAGAAEPKQVNVSAEILAAYAGDYASSAFPLSIKVVAEGGVLKGQAEGQPQFALAADSPTEFSFAPAGIRMVFDGKDSFVLHQAGREFVFKKKEAAK